MLCIRHTSLLPIEVFSPAAAAAGGASVEKLRFMSPAIAEAIRSKFGSPVYVYDAATLKRQAAAALAFPHAYGLTVRYAMKSSPNAAILKLFDASGLHVDASSGYEVRRAFAAGVAPSKISLSSQELPPFFPELAAAGVLLNACSLTQLEAIGSAAPGSEVGLRFNPGLGSGGTSRTNVGGPSSSFGIWHELLPQVQEIVARHRLKVVRIHTHIGSGSDPAVWQRVSTMSLDLCRKFPGVTTLNLGGGYKVGRMSYEASTDLAVVGPPQNPPQNPKPQPAQRPCLPPAPAPAPARPAAASPARPPPGLPVRDNFVAFAKETGRQLHLEIEPGTFLVGNSAALLATVQDVVSTGSTADSGGHTFLKLDAGMTEVLRPSLYGAQHPLVVVKKGGKAAAGALPYVVVGHCCESGDLLTPAPGEPETLSERLLGAAEVGDICVVEGAGAYCSGMATTNYNSFPQAAEVMLSEAGEARLIRKRQEVTQIWANEVDLPAGFV